MRGALRVAGKLAAAVANVAGKKIVKRKELQSPAIAEIVKLVDRSAAILIAKLEIMFSAGIAKVGEVLPVGIKAMARQRVVAAEAAGAVTKADLRQAEILRVGDAGIQADTGRIELLVLRERSLQQNGSSRREFPAAFWETADACMKATALAHESA